MQNFEILPYNSESKKKILDEATELAESEKNKEIIYPSDTSYSKLKIINT